MSQDVGFYERLLEELGDEIDQLERDVFRLLRENSDGVSRQELVLYIFGYWPESLDGNVDDRKIRKAIERMRNRLVPIVSSSGHPGYKLDTSREAVRGMIAEWVSRREKLTDLINAAAKFYSMPDLLVPAVRSAQPVLFVVPGEERAQREASARDVSLFLGPDGRRK